MPKNLDSKKGDSHEKRPTGRKRKRGDSEEKPAAESQISSPNLISIYCPKSYSEDGVELTCGWTQLDPSTITTDMSSLGGKARCKPGENTENKCVIQSYINAVKKSSELIPEEYFMIKLLDDNQFIAPKELLSGSSDYFKRLLSFPGIESTTRTVTFTGEEDEPEIIKRFIVFLHCGLYDGVKSAKYEPARCGRKKFRKRKDKELCRLMEEHIKMYIFAKRLDVDRGDLAYFVYCAAREELVCHDWPRQSPKRHIGVDKISSVLRDGIFKLTEMVYSNTMDSSKEIDPMRILISSLHSFLMKEMTKDWDYLQTLRNIVLTSPELARGIAGSYVPEPNLSFYKYYEDVRLRLRSGEY